MLLLSELDVVELIDFAQLLDDVCGVLEDRGGAVSRTGLRSRLRTPIGGLECVTGVDGVRHVAGAKFYPTTPRGSHHTVALFSLDGGTFVALAQATALGAARTGVMSAAATHYLADPAASVLAVIGTGYQAQTQVAAIAATRRLTQIRVYSRDSQRREGFAEEATRFTGVPTIACATVRRACDGAGIVATVTTSSGPVLSSADLADGVLVNAAGSRGMFGRELHRDVFADAWVVADNRVQAPAECGDLVPLIEAGQFDWNRLTELADVATGTARRPEHTRRTVFESLGSGVFDVVTAAHVVERAAAVGRGAHLDWEPGSKADVPTFFAKAQPLATEATR